MKETKKFFDNNRLNKGYSRGSVSKTGFINPALGQYKHVLPPMEVIAEYEELNPGTIDKILELAKKEQEHRHSLEVLTIEKHDRAIRLGRKCSLILVAIIAVTAIILTFGGHYGSAAFFSIGAFGTIMLASFFYSDKTHKHKPYHRKFNSKHKNSNLNFNNKKQQGQEI